MELTTKAYKQTAKKAIADPILQSALAGLQSRLGPATASLYENLPEGPDLRAKAHAYRRKAVDNLDIMLVTLAGKIRENGGEVHFAATAKDAVDICLDIAEKNNVKHVVKGKSMVTEEIGLNRALMDKGIEVNETDLGEYIIQLAGEKPSHIVAPAVHKTRKEVGELFTEKLGTPYTDDPPTLTRDARQALRKKFMAADMGISGCNLACAETGHITTVSNEGNIRMATTLPRVHVAFMGMERIAANLEEHQAILRLMSMGAAAQQIGGYVSYIGGPAAVDHADGPQAFHLVIVDNGRSRILADEEFREMLCCIRCGACLNVCPVYGKIGGHSYGSAYTGPVGAVVTPLLGGINEASHLCQGESLCGACRVACPLNLNLPRMLLALRAKLSEGDPRWNVKPKSRPEKMLFQVWSRINQNRKVYDILLKLGRLIQKIMPSSNHMIRRLPWPFSGWTQSRDMKPLAGKTFMELWKEHQGGRS
ncbi:iron-sulfur cluster-binding protein (ferredoxin family protein) [Desulforapulum autotrophicum HRM2]|uniref:Iron-sulfur cluster-binding protein (Ferredoxin family protein) n=1 Tax=Desulforapulum autotrophicum (strain ATCC 43914 / DSM 3382 / VKM B-1955 / HRM2) TaxID=177437 RepID=C0Q9E6_DESAH|nr:LutB/LldF family L-lactate oxidation iron-sulfur protein [Desulforapulum autotrophicum]ACN14510.1 iron-sulfur cluster-binding protein (ferredoxin family protein) [Desulforapulum autotrophicum HRM2]